MLASILLASFFAEAKSVTCDLVIYKKDYTTTKISVVSTVLEESDLRYKLDVYSEVTQKVVNADEPAQYKNLIVNKGLCREQFQRQLEIIRYYTEGQKSIVDARCPSNRLIAVEFDTNKLKKYPLNIVFEKLNSVCQK